MQEVHHAACGTGNRIRATENHASNSCMDQRACAHRAGLLRHVEVALGQSPIANSCLSLRQRQHFRVRGGVLEQFHLIMGARDNLACPDNNRSDRNFTGFVCFLRLSQCFAHEVFVAGRFNHCLRCSHGPVGRPLLTNDLACTLTGNRPVATGYIRREAHGRSRCIQ